MGESAALKQNGTVALGFTTLLSQVGLCFKHLWFQSFLTRPDEDGPLVEF